MLKKYVFLLFLSFLPNPLMAENFFWYAYGDLRGYIEACGCNPETDLGGVIRLSNQIESMRQLDKSLIVFDLGNNLDPLDITNTRSKYINQALDMIKPTVTLMNRLELSSDDKKNLGSRSYLLSNGSHSSALQVFENDQMIVYGFVEPFKDSKYKLDKFNSKLLSEWRKKLLTSSKKRVLLYSGSKDILQQVANELIFDVIISSNQKPLDMVVDNREKANVRELLVLENPLVYMVPIGGQGLLRGGTFPEAVNLNSINEGIKKGKTSLFGSPDQKLEVSLPSVPKLIDWLSIQLAYSSRVDQVMAEYNSSLAKEFEEVAKKRLEGLKNTPFAGANVCKTCHIKEWEVWGKSQHARAYETLKEKSKHQDDHCVKCHVLGLETSGGFVSEEATPQFKGVQCENCHGPLKNHVKSPVEYKPGKVSEDMCVDCHHTPHTTGFDYEAYWPKIKH